MRKHDGGPSMGGVVASASAQRPYLTVRVKFLIAVTVALLWTSASVWLSLPWLRELSVPLPMWLAVVLIAFIAYLPGFMNSFLMATVALDRRPSRRLPTRYPGVSVLVACYNEEANIADTLYSLARQDYPGTMEVVVVDDGSRDRSADVAREACARHSGPNRRFRLIEHGRNGGKSRALNRALAESVELLVITVDGDSWARADAVRKLVERFLGDPEDTVAVAGAVLARNSRVNWLTRAQEWDYFHGIAAVKRMQSMYHGTLVAQGAFSLYTRDALLELDGWPECVGEDIVLTWAMLERGWRVGYCEDACVFTNVPETFRQFARQRQRWSRGLVEAFQRHGRLLLKPRMTTLFIWWNLCFLPMDLVYTFAFLPGILLGLCGYYYIAGPMTLAVLPFAVLWNGALFRVQSKMFKTQGLRVRRNRRGLLLYTLVYTMILQPVCVWGYFAELLHLKKTWGTK